MASKFTRNFLLILAAVFYWTSGASAHEAWLEPKSYNLEVGEELLADYKIGANYKGNSQPFITNWHRDYRLTNGDTSVEVAGENGQRPSAIVPDVKEGLNILTLHTSTSRLTFNKWEKFQDYLKAQGIEQIEAQHLERGLPKTGFKEGYRRNPKALIQVGDTKGKDQAVGLPFEFVLLDGLYGGEGDPIEIQLLWQGVPQAGAQVQVWDKRNVKTADDPESDKPQQTYYTTDENGRFSFTPSLGGTFMMSSVHMVPGVENDEGLVEFAWDSFWANLTFAR